MGLDMFLTKKVYIGANYEHRGITGKIEIYEKTREGKEKININLNKISYIEEQVAYWRKANHIHKWLVENIQEGIDDCKEYIFPYENIKELISICKKVIELLTDSKTDENNVYIDEKVLKEVQELLPTENGFFFGSTEIDQYYLEDCKYTLEILENTNSLDDYYYHSSW